MTWPWAKKNLVANHLTATIPRAPEHVSNKNNNTRKKPPVIIRLNSVGEISSDYSDLSHKQRNMTPEFQTNYQKQQRFCESTTFNFVEQTDIQSFCSEGKGLMPELNPAMFGSVGSSYMMNSQDLYRRAQEVQNPPCRRPVPQSYQQQIHPNHWYLPSNWMVSDLVGYPLVQQQVPVNGLHHVGQFVPFAHVFGHVVGQNRWTVPPNPQCRFPSTNGLYSKQPYVFTASNNHRQQQHCQRKSLTQPKMHSMPVQPKAKCVNPPKHSMNVNANLSQDINVLQNNLCHLHISSDNFSVDQKVGAVPSDPVLSTDRVCAQNDNTPYAPTKVLIYQGQNVLGAVTKSIDQPAHNDHNTSTHFSLSDQQGHNDLLTPTISKTPVLFHQESFEIAKTSCDTSDGRVYVSCDSHEENSGHVTFELSECGTLSKNFTTPRCSTPEDESRCSTPEDESRCSTPEDESTEKTPVSCQVSNLTEAGLNMCKKKKKKSRPSAKKRQRMKKQRQDEASPLLSKGFQNMMYTNPKRQKTCHKNSYTDKDDSADDSISFENKEVASQESKSYCPINMILGCDSIANDKKESSSANSSDDSFHFKIRGNISFFVSPSDSGEEDSDSDDDWDCVDVEETLILQDDILKSLSSPMTTKMLCVITKHASPLPKSASSPEIMDPSTSVEAVNARWYQVYGRQESKQQPKKKKVCIIIEAPSHDYTIFNM